MTQQVQTVPESGDIITVPLNHLKASPRNARRTPHAIADIEALAASIAVKGVLQAPVVEPETDGEGAPTGVYLVTIGEGRRQALLLLAKRKLIGKAAPVRCVVDLTNDPHEISLDENVTRAAMHPADQFEAFRKLSEDRGLGAEEIAARFGVSAHVVRQRLRLPAMELLDLLAHCASLSVNVVRSTWDRRPKAWAQADALAEAVGLDMGAYWTATAESYLGRVTKARIGEAVREAVSAEAAARIEGLKKPDMASEAERLLAGTGWLPVLLRKPDPAPGAEVSEAEAEPVADAA